MMLSSLRTWFMKSPSGHTILSHLAAVVMRFLHFSCRVSHQFEPQLEPFYSGDRKAIFTFWHGRMIMLPFLKPRGKIAVLISHHNDGALITTTMRRFDIGAVRGSRKSGGSEAVRSLVEAAAQGTNIAITPDGPRGPYHVAAPGAIYVAMRTGLPIVPMAFSASRFWRLSSWDRFMIPKPFSHIVFRAGEPYTVPRECTPEQLKEHLDELTRRLNDVTAKADAACMVSP